MKEIYRELGRLMTKDEWYTQLFERLDNSKFRSGFHFKKKIENMSGKKVWRRSGSMPGISLQSGKLRL